MAVRSNSEHFSPRFQWCWYAACASSPTTFSFLAILETVLACTAMIYVGLYWQLWRYLLLCSLIAPFVLLRTERTVRWGIVLFRPAVELARRTLPVLDDPDFQEFDPPTLSLPRLSVRDFSWSLNWVSSFMRHSAVFAIHVCVHLLLLIFSLLVRCVSTLACSLLHPIEALQAPLGNWKRAILCEDVTSQIEMIPGFSTYPLPLPQGRETQTSLQEPMSLASLVALVLSMFPEESSSGPPPGAYDIIPARARHLSTPEQLIYQTVSLVPMFVMVLLGMLAGLLAVIAMLFVTVVVAVAHLLPWWYSWSLKSTSLVWAPLIYIAGDIAPLGWDANRRLSTIIKAGTAMVSRGYASFVAVTLLIKFAVQIIWHKAISSFSESGGWLWVVSPLVQPVDIPMWQLLSLINAIGAWVLYLFADWQIRKREHDEGLSDLSITYCLTGMAFVRWAITIYTIGCTFIVLYEVVKRSHPPVFRLIWLPSWCSSWTY